MRFFKKLSIVEERNFNFDLSKLFFSPTGRRRMLETKLDWLKPSENGINGRCFSRFLRARLAGWLAGDTLKSQDWPGRRMTVCVMFLFFPSQHPNPSPPPPPPSPPLEQRNVFEKCKKKINKWQVKLGFYFSGATIQWLINSSVNSCAPSVLELTKRKEWKVCENIK